MKYAGASCLLRSWKLRCNSDCSSENARESAAPWTGADAVPVRRHSRVATTARVKRFIRGNDIALWPPGGAAFCAEHGVEMRAYFGIIRVDLQRPPQLDESIIELALTGQREAQFVVRDRVVWPQKHRLPRVRLRLVK